MDTIAVLDGFLILGLVYIIALIAGLYFFFISRTKSRGEIGALTIVFLGLETFLSIMFINSVETVTHRMILF